MSNAFAEFLQENAESLSNIERDLKGALADVRYATGLASRLQGERDAALNAIAKLVRAKPNLAAFIAALQDAQALLAEFEGAPRE